MPMSDYLESIILNTVLNSVTYSEPASVYIGLYTVAPTDAGGGTEVSGTGYARQTMTSGWTVSGTATRAFNAAPVTFPIAGGSWGTVTSIGIFDAISGGNLLFWGTLTASKGPINSTDQLAFPLNTLAVTLA